MSVLSTFNISAVDFIENGETFTVVFGFEDDDTKIAINNYIEKNDEKRTLVIKGDYQRSSITKIPLNHHENKILEQIDLNHMFEIAKVYMIKLIPKFLNEDYPESLKKEAESKNNNKN